MPVVSNTCLEVIPTTYCTLYICPRGETVTLLLEEASLTTAKPNVVSQEAIGPYGVAKGTLIVIVAQCTIATIFSSKMTET